MTAIKYGYDDIVSISYQIMAIVKRRSYNFTAEIIHEILGNFQVKLECLLQPPDSMNMEHKWMIMTNENLAYEWRMANKEFFQQRHQTDRQVNNRKSQVT